MVKELTITRIFDAPRDLVFRAWIDPIYLARWWGPKDFTNPVCEVDARPGGSLFIQMTGPDGIPYPVWGKFHELVEPERIVLTTTGFTDEQGNHGLEVLNNVTFEAQGNKTKLTLHAVVVKALPGTEIGLAGMEQGWNESLDRLAESLA